jgi:thioredoxin
MNKQMFVDRVFDYNTHQDWMYKGDKPAIIDFYADWCGPCRMTTPIMKELAKEYDGQIVVYKVNVDKERELAALFNATSIPLFVFIPLNDQPQLFRGAADKATYKKVIDDFLLKQ